MIVRAGTGWQYALADLSLILFLATASALSQTGGKAKAEPAPPPPPIAAATESEPVAVWSMGKGAPPLRTWLGQVGQDPRLEVRVIVRYVGDTRLAALAQAVQLAEAGGPRAKNARILVEPGERAGAVVALIYTSETTTLPGRAANGVGSGTMIAG